MPYVARWRSSPKVRLPAAVVDPARRQRAGSLEPGRYWPVLSRRPLGRRATFRPGRAAKGRRTNPYFMSAQEVDETLGIVRQLVDWLAGRRPAALRRDRAADAAPAAGRQIED